MVMHLQHLQGDGPEPGLHFKGTLSDSACLRMMTFETLGCHTLQQPLVGSDEASGCWR